MNKILIATVVSVFALNGAAYAATSNIGDFRVDADTIKMGKDPNKMHVAGHVVIKSGNTTIKLKRATLTKNGDQITISTPGNHAITPKKQG
jgi:lipopolysaccharide export system protein LptA